VSVGEKVVAMCRLGWVGQSGILLFASEWAITWRRNYFLRKNCPTYDVRILRCYVKLSRKQRGMFNVAT